VLNQIARRPSRCGGPAPDSSAPIAGVATISERFAGLAKEQWAKRVSELARAFQAVKRLIRGLGTYGTDLRGSQRLKLGPDAYLRRTTCPRGNGGLEGRPRKGRRPSAPFAFRRGC